MIFDKDGPGYVEGLRDLWYPEKLRTLWIFKAEEDPMFNTSKDDIQRKAHTGSRDAHGGTAGSALPRDAVWRARGARVDIPYVTTPDPRKN